MTAQGEEEGDTVVSNQYWQIKRMLELSKQATH
jgi:hypothetical protein